MRYDFIIPLTPVVKKNSRPIYRNKQTGKPFLGKSAKLSAYEEQAGFFLRAQKAQLGLREALAIPLRGQFYFVFEKEGRSDTDNLVTTVLDLAQAVGIITNDKNVKRIEAEIVGWSGKPSCTYFMFEPYGKPSFDPIDWSRRTAVLHIA